MVDKIFAHTDKPPVAHQDAGDANGYGTGSSQGSAWDSMSLMDKMVPGSKSRADAVDAEASRRQQIASYIQSLHDKVPTNAR